MTQQNTGDPETPPSNNAIGDPETPPAAVDGGEGDVSAYGDPETPPSKSGDPETPPSS